ncbi:Outer membrane OMP85 family protein isoform 2 [Hibiscus syriacus]|uniref:Outer membrane OMP85 family protein isoform 2 n=1 Tax=Hibiscus syriacus TaxID=106335 RepID=A0A6A3CDD1_HIBSY|nr:Outer membrane OMP85 family protein isoform 2 [Hibiscus syriacus]
MGAQKSIHAGKAKIDVNVDFTHKICASMMLPSLRNTGSPLSLVMGSLCIKHPNLFGGSEKLDVSWDKGLYDSNILVAYRRPRPQWVAQQCFVMQHSLSPEIGVHGIPVDNFSRSGSGGVNLSRLSVGLDVNEPASSKWSSTTSIKFENVHLLSDDGRSITRDIDGFPVTCSGNAHDSMVVLKQESQYAKATDHSFSRGTNWNILLISVYHANRARDSSSIQVVNLQPFQVCCVKGHQTWTSFSLDKASNVAVVFFLFPQPSVKRKLIGVPGLTSNRDMAPYQAFAIGGLGSVRGYGEGAVGSGRSCLIANTELTIPFNKMLEGSVFLDCGTDLGSGRLVPGNPALRQGKPGSGVGVGYGLRFKSPLGHFQVDYAINAFQQKTLYFGVTNLAS